MSWVTYRSPTGKLHRTLQVEVNGYPRAVGAVKPHPVSGQWTWQCNLSGNAFGYAMTHWGAMSALIRWCQQVTSRVRP